MNIRIKGIDRTIRNLANTNQQTLNAAQAGCKKAAEHLKTKIVAKIGVQQPGWEPLTWETRMKKLRKYGFSKKPLLASGEMKNSFYIKMPHGTDDGKSKAIAATVTSDDPKLFRHVYGEGVPKRDPVLTTTEEERGKTHDIVRNEIKRVYKGVM